MSEERQGGGRREQWGIGDKREWKDERERENNKTNDGAGG